MAVDALSSGNSMSSLAQTLFKTVDTNGDNRLSRDEFAAFLEHLVQQVSAASTGGSNLSRALSTTESESASTADYVFAGLPDPSNYRARGYDFDHPDPVHLKPMVSQLLYSGKVAPTHDWVTPDLVAQLNHACGIDANDPNAFRMIDSETLGFSGNEYVHSAPVGYGLLRGDYNPNAAGEFFWGASDV